MGNAGAGGGATALVVYATTEGQTAKVAGRISTQLGALGAHTVVREVGAAPEDLTGVDLVVVGGSIHVGAYQPEIIDWVERHLDALRSTPSAFFSVSLTSADHTPEAEEQVKGYIETFEEATGWVPEIVGLFGGALAYTRYGFVKKRMVRMIAGRGGRDTDLTRDHEYTDWVDVDHFATQCAELVGAGRQSTSF